MRGIFWIVKDELLAVPFKDGDIYGLSKSGDNYNHRLKWPDVRPAGCRKPFDYYPRGRVEYTNKGRPKIYMNHHVDERFIKEIMAAFELDEVPLIDIDGSEHYKCHLD